jgi:hypothetical protein
MCQLAVNPVDGSCWAADMFTVTHYSAQGVLLSETPVMCCAWTLAVDPRDASCWVAANSSFDLVQLSQDGFELSRHRGILWTDSIAVNSLDGSLWIADNGAGQVAHLGWYAPRFSDIPYGFWARSEIEACADANVVCGHGDGAYHPDAAVSRDQMAVFISRALAGGDENVPAGPRSPSFFDVPRWHWAYNHVEYAKAQGVVTGYAGTFYAPNGAVTRDEIAVYMARARGWVSVGEPMNTTGELFADIPAGFWAGAAVRACLENGLVEGYGDGLYHPDSVVTRDQMAVYIARAFELAT